MSIQIHWLSLCVRLLEQRQRCVGIGVGFAFLGYYCVSEGVLYPEGLNAELQDQ